MKVQIIFYSMYGHIYQMAEAVAQGAGEWKGGGLHLSGANWCRRRFWRNPAKKAREAFAHIPIAQPLQLADADAVIFGTPTVREHVFPDAQLSGSDQ